MSTPPYRLSDPVKPYFPENGSHVESKCRSYSKSSATVPATSPPKTSSIHANVASIPALPPALVHTFPVGHPPRLGNPRYVRAQGRRPRPRLLVRSRSLAIQHPGSGREAGARAHGDKVLQGRVGVPDEVDCRADVCGASAHTAGDNEDVEGRGGGEGVGGEDAEACGDYGVGEGLVEIWL